MAIKIFINYRREDASAQAARLRDRLAAREAFGDANVVMDVDYLLPGQRFEDEIKRALSDANVFLTVIGPRWAALLTERAASGERDFVREEIAGALARGIIVIPVLMDGAPLPRAAELPEDIRGLLAYHKHEITHETFGRDAVALAEAIKQVLRRAAKGDPKPTPSWKAVGAIAFLISIIAACLVLAQNTDALRAIWSRPLEGAASRSKVSPQTISELPKRCDNRPDLPKENHTFKVIGGSDTVEAKEAAGSSRRAFVLELLRPYTVICDEDQLYRVVDQQSDTSRTAKVGYVLKNQVYPWPTREALNFTAVAFTGDRPEIVAWDDKPALERFLETGNLRLGPPTFKEDIASTLKRERATRPYPVLSSEIKPLRKVVDKRVFKVLLPVVVPPEFTQLETTFVIAFDATGSMSPFAAQFAKDMRTAFESLPPQIVDRCKIGFVFYRDETDDEKYVIINPQLVADAIRALGEAATPTYMIGGGDEPEPVLDAVYIAHHLYPWAVSQKPPGRRIIIAVLGDDAKPTTLGKIHDGVPPGIDAKRIAADLLADGIPVVTVQAGPKAGPNLMPVLSTLSEGTGGTFIEWKSGSEDEHRIKVVSAIVAQLMRKVEEDKKAFSDYPTIPLGVLDGDKLRGLREAATRYGIDPGKGGVLVRESYVLENNDLLESAVSIDKATLESLVTLTSALAVTNGDVNAMKDSVERVLSTIAGDNYDPKETIAATIRKRLGIQFRTKLFEFNLEFLTGLTGDERLALTRRFRQVEITLQQFLDANLEALDKSSTIWMPVSQLP